MSSSDADMDHSRPTCSTDKMPAVAIFLCAGYGTRMGALTKTVPKPLLPVAGRPVLDYLLEQILALPNLRAIHLVSNHRYAGAFEDWANSRRDLASRHGLHLEVHDDGSLDAKSRLGAIGDLAFVLERIGRPSAALICAGDNILRFSLEPFWQAFSEHGESRVLALHEPRLEKLQRTGVLELGPGDRVLSLAEKPENPPSHWACPSFYALDSRCLAEVPAYLAAGQPPDEIGRLLAYLVPRYPIWAHRQQGERLHVGRPLELENAERTLRSEPVLQVPLDPEPQARSGASTSIDPSPFNSEEHA